MGKSTISMAIFNSYVSLPEGKWPEKSRCSCFFDRCYYVTIILSENILKSKGIHRGPFTWVRIASNILCLWGYCRHQAVPAICYSSLKFQRCNLTIPCLVLKTTKKSWEILKKRSQSQWFPGSQGGHRKAAFAVSCTLAASPPESSFPRTPGRWALENRRIGPPKNLQKHHGFLWLFPAFPRENYEHDLQRLDYAGFDIWDIFISTWLTTGFTHNPWFSKKQWDSSSLWWICAGPPEDAIMGLVPAPTASTGPGWP